MAKKKVTKKRTAKKATRKTTRRTTRKRTKKVVRRGRPSKATIALGAMTTEELEAELARREQNQGALLMRRDELLAELDEINAQLGGGRVVRRKAGKKKAGRPRRAGAGRKRPKNKTNLVDALAVVLKGKQMSVTEVAAAVQKAGYKTSSANFRTIVNQALIKNTKVFKKVSRGLYTAA
jgi:hypothetical protein